MLESTPTKNRRSRENESSSVSTRTEGRPFCGFRGGESIVLTDEKFAQGRRFCVRGAEQATVRDTSDTAIL